jgi:hypothetical protein
VAQEAEESVKRLTAWQGELLELSERLGFSGVGVHLAILLDPWFTLLVEGVKTVESRWSNNRCAPHGVLHRGDCVFIKRSGNLVTYCFTAGDVWSLHPMEKPRMRMFVEEYERAVYRGPVSFGLIREMFGGVAGVKPPGLFKGNVCVQEDERWAQFEAKRWGTLVEVKSLRMFERGVRLDKTDRRGWVAINRLSVAEAKP